MRTLHVGLRVADPERALAFYTAVGYEVVGRGPRETGTGLSHLVLQVESMTDTVTDLRGKGIEVADPRSPDGSADFLTSWITDPDGNRIELVQWPAGHADGLTADDWA